MSFIESPRFPDKIGFGAAGGPQFRTSIVMLGSGHEQRNADWSVERRRYDLAHAAKLQADLDEIAAFFLAVARGRLNGFRFRDWSDYNESHGNAVGILGAGVGTGLPAYQLAKRYSAGANTHTRAITKPVSGTVSVTRAATPVTFGAGAGQLSIDTTTGILTFVADVSRAISSHTPGASHVFTTAADVTGLGIGAKIYLAGITGTASATLNAIAHTISNKTGSGPYTWTLSTSTTGLTASGGTAEKYPQPSEALAAAFDFDVPVRFDIDDLISRIEDSGIYGLDAIPLVELRT